MAFDFHAPVAALRNAVATAVSATEIAEAGTGTDLSQQGEEFYAMRVGSVEIREAEPAALDTTVLIPVEIFYCRKKTAGAEGAEAVRVKLAAIAEAIQDKTWKGTTVNLALVTGQGTGDADTYGSVFVDAGHMWDAGHVECELTVIC